MNCKHKNKGKRKKGKYGKYKGTLARNNAVATSNNKEGKYPPLQHCAGGGEESSSSLKVLDNS